MYFDINRIVVSLKTQKCINLFVDSSNFFIRLGWILWSIY